MTRPEDERLVEKFVDRAQRGLSQISDAQLDDGWHRLQQSNLGRPSTSRRPDRRRLAKRLGFAGVLVGAALAAAYVYLWVTGGRGAPLHFVVEGGASNTGGAVSAPADESARVVFSDESTVELSASTKVNIDAIDARGARVTLIDGAIDVHTKPRSRAFWTFAAGPFQMEAKGTVFVLAYAAQAGRMNLHVADGSVEVVGPRRRALAVAGGETIELLSAPTLAAAPDPRAGPVPTVADDTPPAEGPADPTTPPTTSWPKLVTQGKLAEVIMDVEARGLETMLAQGSALDLSALAEAARNTQRDDLARQALLAIRARFPATESARDASFFLGRIGEGVPGQPDAALGWYETYLREAPRGIYASEAMGREITLLAAKNRGRARKLAREYLERFPHGSQANLARTLVEAGNE